MLRVVPDPDILPDGVARRSVAVDLFDTAADLATTFPGLALPAHLANAVRKRHVEYLAGRWCAREAMRARHPERVGPVHTSHDRAPVWPDGVVGSITHTQGFAAAAVADARAFRAVGIDSEQRFTHERAARLRDQFVRDGELDALARSGLDEALLAGLVFSAKESVYKCLHPFVGRFFGFHAAQLVAVSPREGAFVARLTEHLTAEFCVGYELRGRYAADEAHVHTAIALAR